MLEETNAIRCSSRPAAQTVGSACHSGTAEAKAVPHWPRWKRTSLSTPRACLTVSPRWKSRVSSSRLFRTCTPSTSGQSRRRHGREGKWAAGVQHLFPIAVSEYTYSSEVATICNGIRLSDMYCVFRPPIPVAWLEAGVCTHVFPLVVVCVTSGWRPARSEPALGLRELGRPFLQQPRPATLSHNVGSNKRAPKDICPCVVVCAGPGIEGPWWARHGRRAKCWLEPLPIAVGCNGGVRLWAAASLRMEPWLLQLQAPEEIASRKQCNPKS